MSLPAATFSDAVDQAERTAAGEYARRGARSSITAPIVFGRLHVLPVVVEFLKAYPEIDVRLVLTDRVTNFVEDHVDVARAHRRAARQQPDRHPARQRPPGRVCEPGLS